MSSASPWVDRRPISAQHADLASIDWRGRRVTVMGLGRHGGGVAVAKWLARRGAILTISDVASADDLKASIDALAREPIANWHLGRHLAEDFLSAEAIVVNPAVRPGHPLVEAARAAGARLFSEVELLLSLAPGHVIGVTGSNGKSTTATMLHAMLVASGRQSWLGGNIGGSLLDSLDRMTSEDWIVFELSSFQLASLSRGAKLPQYAVVTNFAANHLDWHGDMSSYEKAKQRLLLEQTQPGTTVLNRADRHVAGWETLARGDIRWSWPLSSLPRLAVPGEHNRYNAACAAAAAEAAGVSRAEICAALAAFRGLEHRLESLGEIAGRRCFNDSKSTTPAATVAALAAIEGRVWLLAGGQDKGAGFAELIAAIDDRVQGVAVFGAVRESLARQILAARPQARVHSCGRMDQALDWCFRHSRAGDAILLSPACASHDQFSDFAARGRAFRALVAQINHRRVM